ncbi:oxidoreductase domain protein [Methylocaldum marinum]|uniref:Oxidoreductase domain protein n=1 Tax=Methylocaldum marinum TaxID=1432792 RepID=A0A250KPX0_9GAMM|nr:oxidoreductase domain protein [Methylocaldum marinum]
MPRIPPFHVQSGLHWNQTEPRRLTVSYQCNRQEIDVIVNIPESHAAYITFRYCRDKPAY